MGATSTARPTIRLTVNPATAKGMVYAQVQDLVTILERQGLSTLARLEIRDSLNALCDMVEFGFPE